MRNILLAGVLIASVSPVFAARPIAAWDVVPYQRVDGTFAAGVVAFHDKSVKVEFTINGRKFGKAVESPSLNERTGVREFILPFPAGKLSEKLGDREYTLGARVVAEGEKPYELPALTVYANGKGTLGSKKTVWADSLNGNEFAAGDKSSPVKTLARAVKMAGDGGTVYLKEGSYSLKLLGGGFERKYWTLVTPAPGVDRNSVKITAGRPGTEKLHFRDLNLYCDCDAGEYGSIVMGEGGKTSAWFENCNFTNEKGRHAGEAYPFGNKLAAYVTGGTTYGIMYGPSALLLRGHSVKSVATHALPGENALVVNCSVDDVRAADGASSVLITSIATPPSWAGNLIVSGLKASGLSCRVFSLRRIRDCAFADVAFELEASEGLYSNVAGETENVLFSNVSLAGQEIKLARSKDGRGDFKPTDVIMKKCVFGTLSGCDSVDGSKGFDLRDSKVEIQIK